MNIRQWGHHAMGFCMWHGVFLFNTRLGKGRQFNHEEKGLVLIRLLVLGDIVGIADGTTCY